MNRISALLLAASMSCGVVHAQNQPAPSATADRSPSPNPETPGSANTPATSPVSLPEVSTHDDVETFRVKVNLVEVRAVVRDKNGNAVGNLKKEDFRLFDNGKTQVISRFEVEQAPGKMASAAPTEAATKAPEPGVAMQRTTMPQRYVSYLFDDVHLSALDVINVRNAARAHLQTLAPEDRAAIYTTSGVEMLDFTDDRDKLYATLNRIKPFPINQYHSVENCPDISPYMADLILNKHDPQALRIALNEASACAPTPANAARSESGGLGLAALQAIVEREALLVLGSITSQTRIAFDTLQSIVGRTAEAPGQKMVVLVSPGFLLDNEDLLKESQVVNKALRLNVIISALDARGLYTTSTGGDISKKSLNPLLVQYLATYEHEGALAQEQVMEELAYNTGGEYFHHNNDLEAGLRKVTAAPEYSYLLGFAPQALKSDGSFHNLKVKVEGPQKFDVQARKGYFAPSKNEEAKDVARNEIAEQLFSQQTVSDLPVALKTQFFKTENNMAKLAVVVKVDVRKMQFKKENGRNLNDLMVVAAVFDRNGNVVDGNSKTVQMHIKDETLANLGSGISVRSNFDLPPGNYLVRVVVRDAQGKLAAQNDVLDIP